ncbi:glycoside hydrolase family 19 protein [Pseudomonas sp. LABIM340]|uniref:Glycoside hydrolase family 19 protein n=1 Tax=Pseudomonas nitroreducens TaxID=46680 RepID=A0A5R8ZTM3_PSENT|nr:glycoside hydrolase family 19 protein [Pseudomonas nitroreducens]TLP69739.1 glycoside hydrolase family 19 protein [Pseudomonas nitroreducens]
MPVTISLEQIRKLAPSVRSSYADAFGQGAVVFERHGITRSSLRVAHFMAQVLHESGALKVQWESLYYTPKRLPKVWPKRFQPGGPLDPTAYAFNEEKLGNEVYGNRMGNDQPGDGFKFRGRGLLQLTGKDSYRQATQILRHWVADAPDFVLDPDQVLGSQWCLAVAAAEWEALGCNQFADEDSVRKVTRALNGGYVGLAEREDWTRKTKTIWA